ncbi:MAG: hypothetical protein RLY14_1991 [Planctomycetota bacterium]|jgi:hypothetical protein
MHLNALFTKSEESVRILSHDFCSGYFLEDICPEAAA